MAEAPREPLNERELAHIRTRLPQMPMVPSHVALRLFANLDAAEGKLSPLAVENETLRSRAFALLKALPRCEVPGCEVIATHWSDATQGHNCCADHGRADSPSLWYQQLIDLVAVLLPAEAPAPEAQPAPVARIAGRRRR
jgi:hypothetical protein